jgi:hypothetical protein
VTINIALATYGGIILGCDSLSSRTDQAIFPFKDCELAKDAKSNPILDEEGRPLIIFDQSKIKHVVRTVFGGVSKMFCLYKDDDTCVAAVTSGMATVGGVTIAEQAKRFVRKNKNNSFNSVEAVASEFLKFMRSLWEQEFAEVPEEQRHYLPALNFIVAGYGYSDTYGMVFELKVGNNKIEERFPDDDHVGLCWAGMSDYVDRLVKGIDSQIVYSANKQIAEALDSQRKETLRDITKALQDAGITLPEGLELNVTESTPPGIPWDVGQANIDYGNLSTQYAVDLVELLVNTQSGMQRFAVEIPTVGGRTHIGVLKRGEPFQLLNDSPLHHKHIGYSDEF